MIKQIWRNYYKYLNVSKKESIFALILGILATFSETFSIYLLANLITNLKKEKSKVDFIYLEILFLNKNTIIIIFFYIWSFCIIYLLFFK